MIGLLPVLGLLITFILNFIAGPGYTTSVNQGALRVYFMGSVMWSVFAFFTGIFMYSKCSGQLILATDLYSSQYLFSDSLGVSPPL